MIKVVLVAVILFIYGGYKLYKSTNKCVYCGSNSGRHSSTCPTQY